MPGDDPCVSRQNLQDKEARWPVSVSKKKGALRIPGECDRSAGSDGEIQEGIQDAFDAA